MGKLTERNNRTKKKVVEIYEVNIMQPSVDRMFEYAIFLLSFVMDGARDRKRDDLDWLIIVFAEACYHWSLYLCIDRRS